MIGDVERQWRYEVDTDAQAAANKLTEMQEAAASGDPNTPKAVTLMARIIGDVMYVIDSYKAGHGGGGRFRNWLRAVPSDVAASIAIRECIANCSTEDRRLT